VSTRTSSFGKRGSFESDDGECFVDVFVCFARFVCPVCFDWFDWAAWSDCFVCLSVDDRACRAPEEAFVFAPVDPFPFAVTFPFPAAVPFPVPFDPTDWRLGVDCRVFDPMAWRVVDPVRPVWVRDFGSCLPGEA
jgi:hypothetical protein